MSNLVSREKLRKLGFIAVYASIFTLAMPISPYVSTGLIAIAGIILILTEENRIPQTDNILIWGLISFLVASFVSVVFAHSHYRSLLTILTIILPAFLLYLLSTQLRVNHIRSLVWVISLTGGVIAAMFLTIAALHPDPTPYHRMAAQSWMDKAGYKHLAVPNDLNLLAIIAPFALVFLFPKKAIFSKALAGTAVALMIGCVTFYQSRLGISLVVFAVLHFSLQVKGGSKVLIMTSEIIVALAAIFFIFDYINDYINDFSLTKKLSDLQSLSVRIPLWFAAWEMFTQAPVFGHGPGSFSLLHQFYLTDTELPSWVTQDRRHAPWAHNLYSV